MARRVVDAAVGSIGAAIYAVGGAVLGSMNTGWFGIERDTNGLLPVLGVGAGLVVVAFSSSALNVRLSSLGTIGRAARYLLFAGPVLYVVSFLIEFAIFGTFALGLGLICLAIAVWRGRLVPVVDRILITLSAIGSLVWNTETTSAFILVAVGLIWVGLSVRLLGR